MSSDRQPKRRTPRSGAKPLRRSAPRRNPAAEPRTPKPFRVLVVAHRPRYRARIERAAEGAGWQVDSLLNRQDPIGILQSNPPDILVITVDTQLNRNTGYLRAAQPFRDKVQIVALFESAEEQREYADYAEYLHHTPWRARQVRASLAEAYREIRGTAPVFPHPLQGMEEDEEVAEGD